MPRARTRPRTDAPPPSDAEDTADASDAFSSCEEVYMTRHGMIRSWSTALPALTLAVALLATSSEGQKPGACPPAANVGICSYSCFFDSECEGPQRCCRTACGGSTCLQPVSVPNPRPAPQEGMCPPRANTRWICSSRCSADYDCPSGYKCCQSRCGGFSCMKTVLPF